MKINSGTWKTLTRTRLVKPHKYNTVHVCDLYRWVKNRTVSFVTPVNDDVKGGVYIELFTFIWRYVTCHYI